MSIRSPDGALTSDSFDTSPGNLSFFVPSKAVDITKWRADISGQAISGQDLFFTSDFQDFNGPDAFELKDTASEYSMDSAYQSQSGASRRGPTMQEGYSLWPTQDDSQNQIPQFFRPDLSSPTTSSDNFSNFQDTQDMNQVHVDAWYATNNFSASQDFHAYGAATVHQPTNPYGVGLSNFSSEQSLSAPFMSFTTNQEYAAIVNQQTPSQQRQSRPQIDTASRPSTVRSTSFPSPHVVRRESSHSTKYNNYVASPNAAHLPSSQDAGFNQQALLESRMDKDDSASASIPAQSVHDEEEDGMSSVDPDDAKIIEEHNKLARNHEMYRREQTADGLYHCPFEGDKGCGHKATSLKCNYDKYVDSHLKPFRCKVDKCNNIQFSSTACLLRHEREAHGMHGHGTRPHMCHFAGCERAQPGGGFPRRYNLFDHMKRVHDYSGPTTEPSPPAAQGLASGSRKNTRKRKSTADDGAEKKSKVTKLSPQQQLQRQRAQLQQEFLSKKQNIIDLIARWTSPDALSEADGAQLTKDAFHLTEIAEKYRKTTLAG